jgi:hypothetical protein
VRSATPSAGDNLYFTVLNQYFELKVTSFGEDMRGIPNQLLKNILA